MINLVGAILEVGTGQHAYVAKSVVEDVAQVRSWNPLESKLQLQISVVLPPQLCLQQVSVAYFEGQANHLSPEIAINTTY